MPFSTFVVPPGFSCSPCPQGSLGWQNHLEVRDYLCTHPETAYVYGEHKNVLAQAFPHDFDRYVDGKTDLLLGILHE
ncbi:MAG: GrpB family protein [Herpetosiphonaceae bacterium]|nr:GrpB family protein [Herpetosiphonaceae bacterium]